jgi:SAM-dependent methyltransferase
MASFILPSSEPSPLEAKERLDIEKTTDRLQAALHNQRFEFVLKQFTRVESILEIGTGVGSFSSFLAARCDDYTGIEVDAESVKATSQRLTGNARVLQADARNLPFAPRSFSVIVCLEVLEHLGDWIAGVNGIQKCLQDEGVAVVSVPYRKRGAKNLSNPYHLYEPGESELTRCLKERFRQVSLFYQYFLESRPMTLARVLHIRRLFALRAIYSKFAAGDPHVLSRLRLEPRAHGMKLHFVAVLKKPKPLAVAS